MWLSWHDESSGSPAGREESLLRRFVAGLAHMSLRLGLERRTGECVVKNLG
jgi:hypothetical protein